MAGELAARQGMRDCNRQFSSRVALVPAHAHQRYSDMNMMSTTAACRVGKVDVKLLSC